MNFNINMNNYILNNESMRLRHVRLCQSPRRQWQPATWGPPRATIALRLLPAQVQRLLLCNVLLLPMQKIYVFDKHTNIRTKKNGEAVETTHGCCDYPLWHAYTTPAEAGGKPQDIFQIFPTTQTVPGRVSYVLHTKILMLSNLTIKSTRIFIF